MDTSLRSLEQTEELLCFGPPKGELGVFRIPSSTWYTHHATNVVVRENHAPISRSHGTILQVPCIAHQDGPDLPMLPIALREKGLSYVIITSPEAAKVFLGGWKGAGRPSVPVACVGKSTGEVLEAGGITPVFTPSKATGETLAAEIPFPSSCEADGEKQQEGEHKGPRILYPASAKAQMTLEEGLSARGFEVQRLNTYDTVPAEWSIEAEAAAASASVATFGSPSAVKTWAARLGVRHLDRNSALAACIGETSAKACREAGWSDATIFYPEKPGIQGWAEAVRNALTSLEATP